MTTGMADAVRAAIDAQPADDRDGAAVELALTYARDIDAGGDLAKVGPALLAALTALGLTPAARAAVRKGAGGDSTQPNRLDELRARRARKSRAQDLDTAAP